MDVKVRDAEKYKMNNKIQINCSLGEPLPHQAGRDTLRLVQVLQAQAQSAD